MSIFELVSNIRLKGIELELEGGRLKVTKREGAVLNKSIIDEMKANHEQIIDFLTAEQSLADDFSQGKGTLSASDYEFSDLSDEDLVRLQKLYPNAVSVYQATAMQEGMVFHGMFEDTSSAYLTSMNCYLEGDVCPVVFESSWQKLVARHDIFRTCFFESQMGKLHQVVLEQAQLKVNFRDLSDADDTAIALCIEQLEGQQLQDLQQAPLMSLSLLKLEEGRFYFHWCYHHLLMDGWCQPVLLAEVMQFYQASDNQQLALNPVQPYRNYIRWLNNKTSDEAESFWRDYLAGVSSPTQIAIDKLPMLKEPTSRTCNQISFSGDMLDQLQNLARCCNTTISVVFQTAWLLLLSRYSGEQDIVTGTTVSGRPADLAGANEMIGLFINTVPLRVRLDDNDNLIQLLQKVHQSLMSRDEYSYLPLTEVQSLTQVPNNIPLFEHLLVIDKYDLRAAVDNGSGSDIKVGQSTTNNSTHYPLTMHITLANEAKVTADFHTDKIPGAAIERMLEQYQFIIEQLVNSDVKRKASEIDLLPAQQRKQLICGTHTHQQRFVSVVQQFAEQALVLGEKKAVVAGENALSYSELNNKVNVLSAYLSEQGICKGDKVAVYLERNADLLVALLSVLNIGGVYVPIDPSYPTQRNNYILADSGASLIISTSQVLHGLERQEQQVLLLDDEQVWQYSDETYQISDNVSATDAAYIIYTSGSTGQPKGVVISQSALSVALGSFKHSFGFTQNDVLPCLASQSFDISLVEMLLPIISGGQAVLLTKEQVTDPDCLVSVTANATFLHAVPSLMRLWLNHITDSQMIDEYVHLRTLLVGGEAVPPELVADLGKALPHCQLIQLYGPTENTVLSSFKKVHWQEQQIPFDLGHRFEHVDIKVLDAQGRLCPIGIAGELYLGGSALAQQYLNNPELTTEKFVTLQGERFYRSGDLARWVDSQNNEDNSQQPITLQFLGRIDNQVKIRGFRVEPGEVAQQIKSLSSVTEAVIVAVEDVVRGTQLAAYVCFNTEDTDSAVEETIALLRGRLPDYMVPAVVMPLQSMPLLPNGKLDRNSLPEISAEHYQTRDYEAPQTAQEKLLAQVWEQLLELDKVGIHDNFFELGGHSLIATRMSSLLRHQHNIELPVAAVFSHPTIAATARYLSGEGQRDTTNVETNQKYNTKIIKRIGNEPVLASFSQQRLWLANKLNSGTGEYNMAGSLSITGQLDQLAFKTAIDTIVQRHEMLRTGFFEENDELYQKILTSFDSPFISIDLSQLSESERSAQLKQLITQDADKPFDLIQGPLLRVTLISLGHQSDLQPSFLALFNIHHIACDAWSMNILINEFKTLYAQFAGGQSGQLPDLVIQYADYANWQRQVLSEGAHLNKGLDFWQDALTDTPTLHELPLDFARPAIQGFKGKIHTLTIEGELRQRLQDFCRRYSTTQYMVLQSVFAVLIARLSRNEKVVIGSPVSGRGQQETESLIGFFVNSMAVPSKVSANQNFESFLQQNQQTIQAGFAQQHIPFDLVVEHINPQRSQSHHPVFQLLFAYQSAAPKIQALGELEFGEYLPSQTKSRLDLELYVNDSGKSLDFNWHYSSELFAAQTIASWSESFLVLLDSVIADPQLSLASISLQPTVQAELLEQWNQTSHAPVSDISFLELFAAQCAKTPDAIAVINGSTELSYRMLDEKSTQLAHYLKDLGVGFEHKVPVCLERNQWLHVALLAVLKVQAVFVPLDPQLPDARLEYIISDCNADIVLTQQKFTSRFMVKHAVAADDEDVISLCEQQPTETLDLVINSGMDTLAYIIYTSGSTGKPKGVLIEQQGMVEYLSTAAQQYIQADPNSALSGSVVCTSISFDATLTTLFAPLITGGFVELMPDNRNSLQLLADYFMDDEEQLLFKLTPTHMEALLQTELLEFDEDVAHTLVIGGEQLTAKLLQQWLELFPNMRFCNEYGPTEAVVGCSLFSARKASYKPDNVYGAVPIGRAFSGNQLHILEPNGQSVPFGAIGELYISGTPLARHYLNKPELTEKAFIPANDANIVGRRLYKTGDLVRMMMDGEGNPTDLVFIDRADEQFKLRGYRIEPGEIENALAELDGIQLACVAKRSNADTHDELVAWLLPENHKDELPSSSALFEQYNQLLAEKLPSYMLPSCYVAVAEMPLTANGKLDRRTLQQIEVDEDRQNKQAQPRNQIEETMLGLWQSVLQKAHIDINSDFFALGGHSLLATQLVSRIRETFSVELSLGALFDYSSLAELCEHITSLTPGSQLPDITKVPDSQYPLSYSQQRLWFVQQLDKQSYNYNMPGKFELAGQFDTRAFQSALSEILQRHSVLRSVFRQQGSQAFQQVLDNYELPLQITDLTHLDSEQQQQHIADIETQEYQQPFNLETEIPCRFHLIKLCSSDVEGEKYIVLFSLHHIAADGWSLAIMVNEFKACYEAAKSQSKAMLPTLPVQYGDFACWQKQWLTGEELDTQLQYWCERLDAAPLLHDLPTDMPRPARQTFAGARYEAVLSGDWQGRINEFCQQHQLTLFTFLQTAFSVLVSRHSGSQDIVMGSPISGRIHSKIEDLIGFFVNTLVIRTQIGEEQSFLELATSNKRNVLDAFNYQHVPFELIVETLNPERSLSHAPLVQITFALQNNEKAEMRLTDAQVSKGESIDRHVDTNARLDLELHVYQEEEGLYCHWIYNKALFYPATIERMADNFSVLLNSILNAPESLLSLLPVVNQQDKNLLLEQLNNTAADYPQNKLLHQYPQATADYAKNAAVICGSESISYEVLHQQSNAMAAILSSHKLEAGEFIAVCLPRSVDMVIAMLAVLKSGAAYLPLDPRYPKSRIAYMLKDSKASVVISNSELLQELKFESCYALCVDLPQSTLAEMEKTANESPYVNMATPAHPAYAIYTSGSTGQPKGTVVNHRNASNLVNWFSRHYSFDASDNTLIISAIGFDLTQKNIWATLASGGTVVLPDMRLFDVDIVLSTIATEKVTSVNCTPSVFYSLIQDRSKWAQLQSLKFVFLGGEPIAKEVLEPWQKSEFCLAEIINMYGPTECSDITVDYQLTGNESGAIPIGAPIDNVTVYVLDKQQQLVPVGTPGELYIGGAGVTQGYLHQPELTAEKFIVNPFDSGSDPKLYKTGDIVRWQSQQGGEVEHLEFLNRLDHQIKIRGHRVELSEVETRIRNNHDVEACRVQFDAELQQIWAWVSPTNAAFERICDDLAQQNIGDWSSVFDQTYEAVENDTVEASQSDFAGWVSSYTGEMIPETEMQHWVEETVDQILTLKPRKLLEVGVGTGLLFYRYVDVCEEVYVADISKAALMGIEEAIAGKGYEKVTFCHGSVETLDIPQECKFDTIVINSVIQYFPSLKYLKNTIEKLLEWLTDDGQIFIGDIRNFALLDSHNTASLVGTCEHSVSMTVQQVREQINQLRYKDEELLVSPGYFQHLVEQNPLLQQVDISVKTGEGNNEMLRYRYDVVLHKALPKTVNTVTQWHDWQGMRQFERLLQNSEQSCLGVYNVPNSRIVEDVVLWQQIKAAGNNILVKDLSLNHQASMAPELHTLQEIAQSNGYQLNATWSNSEITCLDLVLYRQEKPTIVARGKYELQRFANYPKIANIAESLEVNMTAELNQHLPDFMLPAGYVFIDSLPKTPNGKVDVKSLPKVTYQGLLQDTYVAPCTELQERMCELWQQLLRLPRIGVNDNFFNLGGHSLLATRMVSKLRSELGIELSISQIFDHPTITQLDRIISDEHMQLRLPLLLADNSAKPVRLSHAQKRLWFIDQLQGGSVEFNMPAAFDVHGPLDIEALKKSLFNLIERHAVLRSTVRMVQGEPEVVVQDTFDLPFTFVDVSHVSVPQRDNQIAASINALTAQSFQLANELPIKLQVIKLPECNSVQRHYLLLNVHHIASDGWSSNVLFKELSDGYRAYVSGSMPQLPTLSVQYKDYAVWQKAWLQNEMRKKLIDYWRSNLNGLPEVHGLPLDKARPVNLGHITSMVSTLLPLDSFQRVEKLAQETGATLFMFMQTAFSLLLNQYSHEQDIVMGTPVAGRYDENVEPLIGMFVNMLVLRTQLNPQQTFWQLLAENKKVLLSAFEHQYIPFDVLVDELNPQRSSSYNPLFQILIVLQNNEKGSLELPGLEINSLSAHDGKGLLSPYDIELQLEQKPEGLAINWQYNVELFEHVSVERMANNLLHLIDMILAKPQANIAELQSVNPQEKSLLIANWSGAQSPVPTAKYIPDVISDMAQQQPQAIAIEHLQQKVSYQELDAESDRLALSLMEQGLVTGDRVGIYLPRCADTIISIVAILKAGGTYVPLDLSYPADRLAYITSDANCKIIITKAEQLPSGVASDMLLDFATQAGTDMSLPVTTVESLDYPAYLIYTSGSTGVPKGVLTGHRAIATHIQAMIELHQIVPRDKVSQFFSFNFDGSIEQIFMALCAGATSVIYDFEKETSGLVKHLCQSGITIADMPPSLFQSAVYDTATMAELAQSQIRTLVLGAETLPPSIVTRWFDSALSVKCRLFNAYGPTEATVTSNIYEVTQATSGSVPIGDFVFGTTGYVVNEDKLCPTGAIGELLLGGVGLASCYWNNDQLTAQSFVQIPELPGQTLYRTGDLVRFRTISGDEQDKPTLEILGRNDNQVKIRGHRIDLGEIENSLGRLEFVKTSIVTVKGDDPLQQNLVAYILLRENVDTCNSVFEAKQHLLSSLPEYMQPSAIIILDHIPVTANGKTDLEALPAPDIKGNFDYVAPVTDTQKALQGIWQDLLKVEQISIEQNFFVAGGNSLLAIRLVNQINQQFSLNVPVRAVFEHPTIEQSAEILDELLHEVSSLSQCSTSTSEQQGFKPTVFVKLKKVGGTSLSGSVLFPYCVKHGLSFVDPGDEPEVSLIQQQQPGNITEKASMLFRHFPDFPKPEAKQWLQDTMGEHNLITLLRNPVNRAISFYNHLSLDKELSFDDYLNFHHEPNHQAHWLGYEQGQQDFLRSTFASVGITERFDESLLLFRRALGMNLDEVLYVKQRDKVQKTITYEDLTQEQLERLMELDNLDWELYRQAETLVQQRVDAIPQLPEELVKYQEALADLTHPLWQQRGDFTIGYSKRSIWAKYSARKGRVIEFQRLM